GRATCRQLDTERKAAVRPEGPELLKRVGRENDAIREIQWRQVANGARELAIGKLSLAGQLGSGRGPLVPKPAQREGGHSRECDRMRRRVDPHGAEIGVRDGS